MVVKEVATPLSTGHREIAPPSPTAVPVDVAKFSALVTRPPKTVKPSKKEVVPEKFVQGLESLPSLAHDLSAMPSSSLAAPRTPSPSPKIRREKPHKPPKVTKDKDKEKKKSDKPGDVAVITETVGSYYVIFSAFKFAFVNVSK